MSSLMALFRHVGNPVLFKWISASVLVSLIVFAVLIAQKPLSKTCSLIYNHSLKISQTNPEECAEFEDWPKLELILTSPPNSFGNWRFSNLLLPSIALFWPKRHFKMTILTDPARGKEFCRNITVLMNETMGVIPNCHLTFNLIRYGWHKSQWVKFWIDNFTSSEYIGIIDTDSPFVTRVTKYDLFRNGKPIVRPLFGKLKPWITWNLKPNTTRRATGFKDVFNCMSFFPFIVKLSHLRVFREIIRSRMAPDGTFNDAFIKLLPHEAEYNIMCTLMWNLFREDYYWIINEEEIGWKGKSEGQVVSFKEAGITPELVGPDPAITHHWGHTRLRDLRNITLLLRKGICFSIPETSHIQPKYCHENRTTQFNKWQFFFEDEDHSSRPGVLKSHLKRLAIIDKCPHQWIDDQLARWSL